MLPPGDTARPGDVNRVRYMFEMKMTRKVEAPKAPQENKNEGNEHKGPSMG